MIGLKIGILSDTHSHRSNALEGVSILQRQGAEFLIHCGDVGDTNILDCLAGMPAAFVFGNCDYDRDELRKYAQLLGIQCHNTYGVLTLAEKRIAVTHGDDYQLMSRLTRPGQPIDYLLTGHTHIKQDQRLGSLRWINPGALYRAAVKTVATLDLKTDKLEYFSLMEK